MKGEMFGAKATGGMVARGVKRELPVLYVVQH